MTYDQCAAYLRSNAILIDNTNSLKAPTRLMHVEESSPELTPASEKSLDQVLNIFHTMANAGGIRLAYNTINNNSFRERLSIPDKIWKELEPSLKDKVNAIRTKLRKQRKERNDNQPKD